MSSIATSSRRRAASPPRRSRLPRRRVKLAGPDAAITNAAADRPARPAPPGANSNTSTSICPAARSLFDALAGAFTRPTFLRFLVLALATLLTIGGAPSATSCAPWARWPLAIPPATTASSRRRRWSSWRLARGLAGWVFDPLVPEGPVFLAGDDTVDEHTGDKVFGKGCHRDPVRSTHSFTAFRWGHKWVVLTVLVRFPWARRLWALPVLVALYRSQGQPSAGHRHKTPARLLQQLCCVLLRWFRQRRFVLSGDGNYGSHEMARFASRHRGRLSLVSKFYPNARLYEPPPRTPGTTGRGSKGPSCPRRSRW